jgi:hypothetical protein
VAPSFGIIYGTQKLLKEGARMRLNTIQRKKQEGNLNKHWEKRSFHCEKGFRRVIGF